MKFNLANEGGPASRAQLKERCEFALEVQRLRLADALVPSGGMVMTNGFFMLRGNTPISQMAQGTAINWFTRASLLLFGWLVLEWIPFEEMFLAEASRYLLESGVTIPIIYVGGTTRLHAAEYAARQFWGVAMARALLNDPQLVSHWSKGDSSHQTCDQNNCTVKHILWIHSPMPQIIIYEPFLVTLFPNLARGHSSGERREKLRSVTYSRSNKKKKKQLWKHERQHRKMYGWAKIQVQASSS